MTDKYIIIISELDKKEMEKNDLITEFLDNNNIKYDGYETKQWAGNYTYYQTEYKFKCSYKMYKKILSSLI